MSPERECFWSTADPGRPVSAWMSPIAFLVLSSSLKYTFNNKYHNNTASPDFINLITLTAPVLLVCPLSNTGVRNLAQHWRYLTFHENSGLNLSSRKIRNTWCGWFRERSSCSWPIRSYTEHAWVVRIFCPLLLLLIAKYTHTYSIHIVCKHTICYFPISSVHFQFVNCHNNKPFNNNRLI